MNKYLSLTEYNQYNYPCIELISGCLISHRGNFLIDHTLSINLIKESEISSFVYINRNIRFTDRSGRIRIRGTVKIELSDCSLDFGVIDYESNSNIIGILGAPFLNLLFETSFFTQIAEDYERRHRRQETSIRTRFIRRICRFLRTRPFRKLN